MRFLAAAIAAVIASTVLSGCMGDPQPWPTVRNFLLAWQSEDYQEAALATTGQPDRVAAALRRAEKELNARDLQMRIERITTGGESAQATFSVRAWLEGIGRRWEYEGQLQLRRRDGEWKIQWSPAVIHPELGANERLAVMTSPPSRAPVLGSDGKSLARATPVVSVGQASGQRNQQGGQPRKQGNRQDTQGGQQGKVKLSGLQLAFRQRLAGTAGSRVVTLKDTGKRADVLATYKGRKSKPVRTTIDGDAQRAAEKALDGVGRPAALVAVQASSGKILAVSNRPSSSTRNRAFTGRFPPGSAFKTVVSGAVLSNDMRVSAPVPCPPKRIVDGKKFRGGAEPSNREQAPSFKTNFVDYCKTAFVGLSRKLPDQALQKAGATFGIEGSWKLSLPAFTGTIPVPDKAAGKAATMIGQGGVRVSPLGMALVAGAVDSGTWHPPRLVTKPEQQQQVTARPLPAGHAKQLRKLMRATVEDGAAETADLPGRPVHGIVGTAGNPNGKSPHAWFVGFRGDVAFAVFVQAGGPGSKVAAPVAEQFLSSMDYGKVIERPQSTRARTSPGG